jgi:stage II sporulation protein D
MELQFKRLFFIAIFFGSFSLSFCACQKKNITVKVLLQTMQRKSFNSWIIYSPKGFVVKDQQTGKIIKKSTKKKMVIANKGGYIVCNGTICNYRSLFIIPQGGYFEWNGKQYKGGILIIFDNERLLGINCLDLESYVYCVLKSESWPGWPCEVNKVFAVMCRSYVISQIEQADRAKRWYHVQNTNVHQTYNGLHDCKVIKQAVEETKSEVLVHDGKPILAMFDSCCGGVSPKNIDNGLDFGKAPYLARKKVCKFCKNFSIYSWQTECFLPQLCSFLEVVWGKEPIYGLKIIERDKAGLVKKVQIRGKKKTKIISGQDIYSCIPGVKSFCFSIKKNGKKIVFEGRGYGHHVGLCQWGAREMVSKGYGYKKILQFYYPGTQLKKL